MPLKTRVEAENVYLQEEILREHNFDEIIGNSPALVELLRKVETIAPTDASVLCMARPVLERSYWLARFIPGVRVVRGSWSR